MKLDDDHKLSKIFRTRILIVFTLNFYFLLLSAK